MSGALDGLKVLDLSRILAGPTCTQLLGDLGAEVIKIENPATNGDDTRSWGPPYVNGPDGAPTDLSAYFMSANRNKKSVAIDLNALLMPILAAHCVDEIVTALETRKIPVGPVNALSRAFASHQVTAREMKISAPSKTAANGAVSLIGNPLKLSKTPVTYRSAPPVFGQDTDRVLADLSEQEITNQTPLMVSK